MQTFPWILRVGKSLNRNLGCPGLLNSLGQKQPFTPHPHVMGSTFQAHMSYLRHTGITWNIQIQILSQWTQVWPQQISTTVLHPHWLTTYRFLCIYTPLRLSPPHPPEFLSRSCVCISLCFFLKDRIWSGWAHYGLCVFSVCHSRGTLHCFHCCPVPAYLPSVPERHLNASQVALRKPQTTALSNTNCLSLLSNTLLA